MISMDLGNSLAVGRTAELYSWEDSQVLKLFYDLFELEDIRFEQKMARAVHSSGLPVPAAGYILQVIVAAALLSENIPELESWLLAQSLSAL
jgi:hypothetical protein